MHGELQLQGLEMCMNNETFQSFIAHAMKCCRRETKYSGSPLHISALLLPAFSPALLPPNQG